MWYWLRKSTASKKLITFGVLSFLLHGSTLLWFFFGFKDRSSQLTLFVSPEMMNQNIEFVFGPTTKQIGGGGAKKGSAQKSASAVKKKAEGVQKLSMNEKTQMAAIPKKPAPKKVVAKKSMPAKATPAPTVEAKKAEPVVEKKPEPVIEKKVEPVVAKPVEDLNPTPPIIKEPEAQPAIEGSDTIALSTNSEGPLQMQIGIHERGLVEEFMAFQQEIITNWAPPPGVATENGCLIAVLVDWQGAIKTVTVEKTSGVRMFDAAARSAISRLTMPRWTWGKTITITFNQ